MCYDNSINTWAIRKGQALSFARATAKYAAGEIEDSASSAALGFEKSARAGRASKALRSATANTERRRCK